jgi:uncharacterized Zn finger protein
VADKTLADVLSKEALQSLAFGESFSRGWRYAEQSRVKALKESDGVITARVRGSDWYDVELRAEPVGLRGRCSCPMGRDGLFCKHCVATGLAWLVQQALGAHELSGSGSPQAIRDYLGGLPRETLVEMVMEQAQADPNLKQRLVLAVARTRPAGPDSDAIRVAIDEATRSREPWSQSRDSGRVRKLDAILDTLKELLAAGHAAAVVGLAAFGLERSDGVAGRMYDPGRELEQVVSRFMSLHLKACAAARLAPEELAKWLFEFELSSNNAVHDGVFARYIELLGENGLAAYRKLAEAEWRSKATASGNRPAAVLARLSETVRHAALMTLDPGLMAKVGSHDFRAPWAYYLAARDCVDMNQMDKAVAWAEMGVKAFPDVPHAGLRELLAEEYGRRGQMTEALNQAWALFTEGPSLDHYLRLRKLAQKTRQSSVWRDEALEYLRERAARSRKAGPVAEPDEERLACGSLIVEILLKEKDADSAWREAQVGGCGEEAWLKLARAREAQHPADAIRIYQQFAEEVVQGGGNDEYRVAVRYLRRAAEIITRLGHPKKFREYLVGYRERNKRKKNLLWLLDREFGACNG